MPVRFVLPLTFSVRTPVTSTSKSFSAAALISALVASLATLKTIVLFSSAAIVLFQRCVEQGSLLKDVLHGSC